jgi:mRNA degradation ribonuclease J1/J2
MGISIEFLPVGQGLFFSAQYGNYRLIYDCGSTSNNQAKSISHSYLKSICSKYAKDQKVTIHTIVLSHLHQDHVSALPYLLKNANVNEVVIPYLSPFERVVSTAF